MAEKKASVVAGKKASVVARASLAAAAAADALGVTGDAGSALGLIPEEALAAKGAQDRLDIRALPVRQYLEVSVVPLLLHGLQLLAIESQMCQTFVHPFSTQELKLLEDFKSTQARPENPVAFLAHYLIENNPMNKKDPLKEEKRDEKKTEEKREEKKEEKEEK